MPVLTFPLPPDHPQFLPAAQLRLYALLMFPNDVEKQRDYFNAVVLSLSDKPDPRVAKLLPSIKKQLLDRARRPMNGKGQQIHPLWVSAMILHGVVYANGYDVPIGVLRSRELLSNLLGANKIRANERTLQRLWNKRRNVAHLDAAYHLCRAFLNFGGPGGLGETLEQLRLMLSIAHDLGEAGCNIVPKGAREPLLTEATIWQIPAEVRCQWELSHTPEADGAIRAAAQFLGHRAPGMPEAGPR